MDRLPRMDLLVNLAKRILPHEIVCQLRRARQRRSPRRLLHRLPRPAFAKYQYPSLLSIGLTTRCNLRCFVCRREAVAPEDLQFASLHKLEEAIRRAQAVNLTGLGESLIYPRFADVVRYVTSLNRSPRLLKVITNGTRLSAGIANVLSGHLRQLTISLNAATRDSYDRDMRFGDFEATLNAIRSFMSALPRHEQRRVKLHFVAHAGNFQEIPAFVGLAADLRIPAVSVGQYLVSVAEHRRHILLCVRDAYNSVIEEAFATARRKRVALDARRFSQERPRSHRECLSPFVECYVDVRGEVAPCCYSGGHSMGNAYQSGFEEVWFGSAYRQLRKGVPLPACRDCVAMTPLDEFGAHFTSCFKRTEQYRESARDYARAGRL